MPRKSDKRERLVESAKNLMFKQGFNLTTLADIAQEADVPLGNVYYYFKTKESIGEAVIVYCVAELNQRLVSYNVLNSPQERLNAFLDDEAKEMEWTLKFGDKFGSLCQELAKQGGPLANECSALMSNSINWLQKQFTECGVPNNVAADKARLFMAKLQGVNLMAVTFKNADKVNDLMQFLRTELNNEIRGSKVHSHEDAAAFA